jgi:hypothetical protein
VVPNIIALRCMLINPAIRVNVIANNGPVKLSNSRHSLLFGIFNLGNIPLLFNADTIIPELISVANAVAAAAPPHPVRNGQAQNNASPTTFINAAPAIIFRGVMESFATMNVVSKTFWAVAAQAIAPRQFM